MTHLSSSHPAASLPATPIPGVVAELIRREPVLAGTGILLIGAMAPTVFAYAMEARTLYGTNVWTKPLKFQASLGLYLITLAWFWAYLSDSIRARRWVAALPSVVCITVLFEVGYISLQAGRGIGSHFNTSTALTGLMFTLMGIAALIFTGASLVLGVLIARFGAPGLSAAFRRGVSWGLVFTCVLGVSSGAVISMAGQHWVGGAPSDAGGLPIFGWSRDGGDLRIAHFFGIHAMHILPIIALVVDRIAPAHAYVMVTGAAVALVALTVGTCLQALGGLPFLPMIG